MKRTALPMLLAVALVVAACGISTEDEPVVLEGAGLPVDAIPDAPAGEAPDGAVVYLVHGSRLEAVPRAGGATVTATIAALLEGPRATDVDAGLRSAIPAGTTLLGVRTERGVTRVDLSAEFTRIVGEEALLALGQLVLTVTSSADSTRVAVSIEGEPVPVARGDGEVTSEPVGPGDYAELLS